MNPKIEEQDVEYVVWNPEEYDEAQEIVTLDEETIQEVEYVETEQEENCEYDMEAEEGEAEGEVEEADSEQHLQGHTIIEHNGRRYMIPNELHDSGQAIVLEDLEEEYEEGAYEVRQADMDDTNEIETLQDGTEVIEQLTYYDEDVVDEDQTEEHQEQEETCGESQDEQQCYMIYGADSEQHEELRGQTEGAALGKQYAVLRDGKLHIESSGGDGSGSDQRDFQDKLQVLEESLTYQNESDVEVTGKNLITGQTISLNGFLEKLKKKTSMISDNGDHTDSDYYPPSVKRQRRSFYNQRTDRCPQNLTEPRSNYILMPPVNKKVLVGETPDGKKIVGKILQIWKKVDPNLKPPKPRTVRKKPIQTNNKSENRTNDATHQKSAHTDSDDSNRQEIEELIIDNTGKILQVKKEVTQSEKHIPKNILLKKKYVSKAFLDHNIVKTLSGLMELESVQKNLAHKNLLIKHVLKKSFEGKVIPGKAITYYYGHMKKADVVDCFNEVKSQWTFISDYRENLSERPEGIDLLEPNSDRQQVDLGAGAKVSFGSLTEPDLVDAVCGQTECEDGQTHKQEFEETVAVNLIVIEDEFGKKRTKVMIPQLGGLPKCQICHKMFRSETHLKRHTLQHSSDGNFTCEVCKRIFHDVTSLFRHNKMHSGNETTGATSCEQREYSCYVCGKSFTSPGSLRRHISVHDHSLRPLQCLTCLQRFTDESSLKKHMLLHTGIKPFKCETCQKSFAHHGDLNFHRKIHDPVKRYQCQVCGKEFNRHSNMVRHADIHKGTTSVYKCDMCGCQYNFISSLTRHIVNNHMATSSDDKESDEMIENAEEALENVMEEDTAAT